MKTKTYGRGLRLFRIVFVLLMVITFAGAANAQDENPGRKQQELVAKTVVSVEDQEKCALVTLSTGCSGSLLRNNWVGQFSPIHSVHKLSTFICLEIDIENIIRTSINANNTKT